MKRTKAKEFPDTPIGLLQRELDQLERRLSWMRDKASDYHIWRENMLVEIESTQQQITEMKNAIERLEKE